MKRNGTSADDQKKRLQDLHGSMRMSAVFGMTPEAEEVGDDRRHASAPSAGSSMQSSEHLERQLRELQIAQEEMKRREEELKREVQMQKEVEERRRRASADSGTRNLTSSGNTSSGIGGVVGMDDAQILDKADEAFDDGRDAMQEMDYVTAKESFERALSLYRSCPPAAVEKSVRADIHHALGTIELETGDDYEKSLINLRTARRMRSSIGDKLGEAMSLKDCARLYAKMGQTTNASRSFQECMEIMLAELGENNPRVHEFFIDIGATAKQLGRERDAIAQFQFALDITQSRHDMKPNDLQTQLSLCSVLHALGILEYHAGDFQDSLKHLRDLANLRSIIGATPTPQDAAILNVISKIHRKLGNFEMGHEASKKALDTSRQQRKEAARASHSSGRSLGSLGSLQNSRASEDKSVNVSSDKSKDPSVYIHLDEQTRVSELESVSPSHAHSYQQQMQQQTRQMQQQTQEMQYIPFILVYDDDHKKQIRRDDLKATMIRVFFKSNKARSEACDILYDVAEMIQFLAKDALQILSSETSTEKQQEQVLENLLFDGCDVSISMIDEYAPEVYGIVISDRLFWEAFVMPHDFQEFASDFIGSAAVRSRRQSNPEAQKQNLVPFHSTERRHPLSSMPCIIQMDDESPLLPHTLIVGIEKAGLGVMPADRQSWGTEIQEIPSDADAWAHAEGIPPDAFEGMSIGSFSFKDSIRSRNPDGTIRDRKTTPR